MQSQHHKERPQLGSRDHDVPLVVVQNLEVAEKSYLHDSTVLGSSSRNPLRPVIVRRAQLSESLASTPSDIRVF